MMIKETIMNQEKLTKLQVQLHISGKGTALKKKEVIADEKLQFSLEKLGVNNISGIEEVNIFTNQGTLIHFNSPKVQASLAGNTFIITGQAETKQLTERLRSISTQLCVNSLTALQRLAAQTIGEAPPATGQDEDNEVPDLGENSDESSKNDAN
ncbi:LOW QUALITY PROTEIN: transcription factor BTF3-like [Glossophaga mutica]